MNPFLPHKPFAHISSLFLPLKMSIERSNSSVTVAGKAVGLNTLTSKRVL